MNVACDLILNYLGFDIQIVDSIYELNGQDSFNILYMRWSPMTYCASFTSKNWLR